MTQTAKPGTSQIEYQHHSPLSVAISSDDLIPLTLATIEATSIDFITATPRFHPTIIPFFLKQLDYGILYHQNY